MTNWIRPSQTKSSTNAGSDLRAAVTTGKSDYAKRISLSLSRSVWEQAMRSSERLIFAAEDGKIHIKIDKFGFKVASRQDVRKGNRVQIQANVPKFIADTFPTGNFTLEKADNVEMIYVFGEEKNR